MFTWRQPLAVESFQSIRPRSEEQRSGVFFLHAASMGKIFSPQNVGSDWQSYCFGWDLQMGLGLIQNIPSSCSQYRKSLLLIAQILFYGYMKSIFKLKNLRDKTRLHYTGLKWTESLKRMCWLMPKIYLGLAKRKNKALDKDVWRKPPFMLSWGLI